MLGYYDQYKLSFILKFMEYYILANVKYLNLDTIGEFFLGEKIFQTNNQTISEEIKMNDSFENDSIKIYNQSEVLLKISQIRIIFENKVKQLNFKNNEISLQKQKESGDFEVNGQVEKKNFNPDVSETNQETQENLGQIGDKQFENNDPQNETNWRFFEENHTNNESNREQFQENHTNNQSYWGFFYGFSGASAGLGVLSSAGIAGIHALGFTASGIAGGSVAAGMMSSAAVAHGGGVIAGSAVALLQTAGATLTVMNPVSLSLVAGGAAVFGVTKAYSYFSETQNDDSINKQEESKNDKPDTSETNQESQENIVQTGDKYFQNTDIDESTTHLNSNESTQENIDQKNQTQNETIWRCLQENQTNNETNWRYFQENHTNNESYWGFFYGFSGASAGLGVLSSAGIAGIHALGFTASGIAGGSVAAGMMSSAAVAHGGGVIAGSAVALLQTAGATLTVMNPVSLSLVAGGAAVFGVNKAYSYFSETQNDDSKDKQEESKNDKPDASETNPDASETNPDTSETNPEPQENIVQSGDKQLQNTDRNEIAKFILNLF